MKEISISQKTLYECYYLQNRKELWRNVLEKSYLHLSSAWSTDLIELPSLKDHSVALVSPPTTHFDPEQEELTIDPFYRFIRNRSASSIDQLYAIASYIGDMMQGFYDPPSPARETTYLGRRESANALSTLHPYAQVAAQSTDFLAKAILLGESQKTWEANLAPIIVQNRIRRAERLTHIPPDKLILARRIQRDIKEARRITDIVYQGEQDIICHELEEYFSWPFSPGREKILA